MKTQNRLIKITVLIGIVLSILVGRVKSSANGSVHFETCNNHTCIPPCTIISESDMVRLEDYAKEDTHYMFIKNLSTGKNCKMFKSDNTTDVIVVECDNKFKLYFYHIYTCFYREVKENGKTKKKYIPYEETTGEEKKMLIVPEYLNDKFMAPLDEAKERVESPGKKARINSAVELMNRALNIMVCRLYINNFISRPDKKDLKRYLEEIGMANTTAYSLVTREVKYTEQNDTTELFKYFEDKMESIGLLVYGDAIQNRLSVEEIRNIKDMKSVFVKEARTIIRQIMNRKQRYTEKAKDDLLYDFLKDLVMFINMLVDNRIDCYKYIVRGTLQDEILKEKEEKVRDRLFKVMNKCAQFPNSSIITINELRDEIGNNEDLSYAIEEKEVRTEPSTEIEKEEELKKKVSQAFERIITSDNVTLYISQSRIVENVKPWNRGLAELLTSLLTKYIEFNGTAEELIEEITEVNAQIASELLNNREKEHETHKNISIIMQIVENELSQIKSIVKNRVGTGGVSIKKTTKEDNEKIISILESISMETDVVTEEEQRMRELLEEMLLRKEQNKLPNKEEDIRDIRTILSEIAEEYTKPETYEVTDKPIQKKKQEIARIVLKKFPIITEDSGILKIKEYLTEIVDSIVDILVDGTVDHAQYKGFNSVKEEIKEEEEHIRKQGLISTLDFVLDFVGKHIFLRSFSFLDKYKFSVIKNSITQMKNTICTENEKTVKFPLFDLSEIRLYDFIELVRSFKKIDGNIDILNIYDELWLNATSFNYHSRPVSLQNIRKPAYIMYKSVMKNNAKTERIIKPTNENLQVFIKARTVQDIDNIQMSIAQPPNSRKRM